MNVEKFRMTECSRRAVGQAADALDERHNDYTGMNPHDAHQRLVDRQVLDVIAGSVLGAISGR